jgi:anti-sigma regulatory factor (Ser/Thr protein kinase)
VGTALAVSSWHDELTIAADGAEVRRASEWLDTACRQHDVAQVLAERLVLCLNEVLANIITHGGSAALAAPVTLLFEVTRDHDCSKASVTVSDAGMPFNPLSAPKRILPKTLAEASDGGWGLVLMRRCADWLDYRHEDGRNHLTFGTRWNVQ